MNDVLKAILETCEMPMDGNGPRSVTRLSNGIELEIRTYKEEHRGATVRYLRADTSDAACQYVRQLIVYKGGAYCRNVDPDTGKWLPWTTVDWGCRLLDVVTKVPNG